MATFNAARHLDAQLASFAGQDHADWRLLASDDGSRDDTRARLAQFAARMPQPVVLRDGPQRGFAANFLSLIAAGTGWAALSDQDDVWHADRLSRGLTALAARDPDRPALWCSATMLVDDRLRPLGPSRVHRHFGFRNALVQNVVAGNTILMNPAARALLAAAGTPDVPYHDWWCYLLVSGAGGDIVYDPEPCLLYRQHGGNVQGENRSLSASLGRAAGFANGTWRGWFDRNMIALQARRDLLDEAARRTVETYVTQTGRPPFARARALWHTGAYRQGRLDTVALYAGSLAGMA